ncbi:NACHT, LRR and PYD domains-containing protein 3 isoform X1 [Carassius auratus]|uniref:NACHT, LRR and PYD domains-containing protein 3 isoform X1 n=1 Tax=Carassius auratus TaxID=7957 RepID=A0A6P6QNN8_CARAU|nr:NACHT, LRR and PYD domains-containing protein 3-like isoform X1 [Carassius auratus]
MSLNEEREDGDVVNYQNQRAASPELSCLSVKSDASMEIPIKFSHGTGTLNNRCRLNEALEEMSLNEEREDGDVVHYQNQRAASPELSCLSVKSDASMEIPIKFSHGTGTLNNRDDWSTCRETGNLQLDPHRPNDKLLRAKDHHKNNMKNKYERLFEGIKIQENLTFLNSIYTQLYIINGESKIVNEEHEVLQKEAMPKTKFSHNTPIYCNDIFKPLREPRCEEKDKIKIVLTKGIAGIGKTVSVQKFILDWTEGKANQDVDFLFVLPFRELNLIKDDQYSLHRLLLDFHPDLGDLDLKIYEECKVVFIFDGLDESRITLIFSDNEKVSGVTETSSVAVLMSNLIKGNLLPSALIWITSRPAAANQIPPRYINRVTEIEGFNEPQKEEYFRKRISDENQASRIISHIKKVRSLHIMCHIPIFCWISSTVLQKLMEEDLSAEIPQTLTEMYIHFLLIQIKMRNQKYEEGDPENRQQLDEVILKLAELAFNQLMKGNVMFYEEDLRECGIDVTEASVYSGMCTEIFRGESVIHQRKVYCFTHLSLQEFLAALYVFCSHLMNNMEPLELFQYIEYENYENMCDRSEGNPLYALLRSAVKKTLQSEKGHLDLFLRFLLGVSLESNQTLSQDLLPHTENSSSTIRDITKYIKDTIKSDNETDYYCNLDYDDDRFSNQFKKHYQCLSADRSINLFLCLLEVKDQTLSREILEFVKSDKLSEKKLSLSHCSAIAYIIQMSDEVLDEFDPMKYNTSEEGRWRLIPAVMNCKKVIFAGCGLSLQQCEILSSALQSSNSCLRELDLSNNDLQDSGVKLLCAGLKGSLCQLNILRLVLCNLTGQCCESLSSALQSLNSFLRELDLSNNDLLDSGVKILFNGLKKSHCQLNILRLSGCMVTEEGCCYVMSVLSSNPSLLKELDLSYNHLRESEVKLLNHPNCTLEKINVAHGGEFRILAGLRKYACHLTLDPNTAHTCLILSEENRQVTRVREDQSYPEHPDRFDECPQVLCRESLSGRCYWEAEWSGYAFISVTYKEVSRKGASDDCVFGFNENSWSLICSENRFTVRHNNKETDICVSSGSSKRVGVYVDIPAGSLSFYSVSDTHTLTHLHTFTSTFTEPLYAGFGFVFYYPNSSVTLCEIEKPVTNNRLYPHT